MTSVRVEHEAGRPRPGLAGAAGYLILNLPLGILSLVTLVVLTTVGLGTAIIWVGVPLLALAVLLVRAGGRIERARIYAMLDTYVPSPYRPLPAGTLKARWKARLLEPGFRRDFAYFLLLFPIGVLEFVLVITFWSVSLAYLALPIYFRFLPDGAYYFPTYELRWIHVDSTVSALPWAALGVLFVAISVALTRALGGLHARFAQSLLGPGNHVLAAAEAETPTDSEIPAVTR